MRCESRVRSRLQIAALLVLGACAPAYEPPPPAPTPAPAPPPPVVEAPAVPAPPPVTAAMEVRVGLLVDTSRVELASPGGLELRPVGEERILARTEPGGVWMVTADRSGTLRVADAGGEEVATVAGPLVARPRDGETVVIGGVPYRGTAIVQSAGAGRVTAINQLDLESYLLGVVPKEIGTVGPELLEAAKAQAVAARTYAIRYLGRRAPLGFDVYATVQDQVYGGVAAEHDPVSRAVLETAGEILVYDGEPIEAFYHSTCAGHTAAIEEVWNESPRPYLTSVVDVDPATGGAWDRASSRFRWTQRWTGAELQGILARTLADSLPRGVRSVGALRDLDVLERTPSGRVRALRIETSTGSFRVGGDRIRWILPTPKGVPLNSSKFDVEVIRDASGSVAEVVATGGGWGHGIGMCQVGAMGRDRAGQDYRQILRAYYMGAEIEDLY